MRPTFLPPNFPCPIGTNSFMDNNWSCGSQHGRIYCFGNCAVSTYQFLLDWVGSTSSWTLHWSQPISLGNCSCVYRHGLLGARNSSIPALATANEVAEEIGCDNDVHRRYFVSHNLL
jgi:hypothetical protein